MALSYQLVASIGTESRKNLWPDGKVAKTHTVFISAIINNTDYL